MPVRIIGMIGVTPPSNDATLHVIEGGLSPSYLTQFARAHDAAADQQVGKQRVGDGHQCHAEDHQKDGPDPQPWRLSGDERQEATSLFETRLTAYSKGASSLHRCSAGRPAFQLPTST